MQVLVLFLDSPYKNHEDCNNLVMISCWSMNRTARERTCRESCEAVCILTAPFLSDKHPPNLPQHPSTCQDSRLTQVCVLFQGGDISSPTYWTEFFAAAKVVGQDGIPTQNP